MQQIPRYEFPVNNLLDLSPLKNCRECKRFLWPGELFANGHVDTEVLCHSCIAKRNHEIEIQLTGENE